jgi:hypothetical protein
VNDPLSDRGRIDAALRDDNPEQRTIAEIGVEVVALLLRKNLRYGSSATNPIRVFSKLEPEAGIRVRLDDKLSRIRAGAADDDEDPILDTLGYLILLLVAQRGAQR